AHPWVLSNEKERRRRDAALRLAASLREGSKGEAVASPRGKAKSKANKARLPQWCEYSRLPAVRLRAGGVLEEDAVNRILTILAEHSLDGAQDLRHLTESATPESLDQFAAHLFEEWRTNGLKAGDRWVLAAVAVFGGAESVRRVGLYIGSWAGG